MDVIQEVEMIMEEQLQDEHGENRKSPINPGNLRPAPVEVLHHVKINVQAETPISTIKGCFMNLNSHLSFSEAELRKAEKQMTQAFAEFYKKLRLLKNYR